MGFLDLILAGIVFNFLYMFFVGSIIFVTVLVLALSGKNVEITLWIHKVQPRLQELKQLRASKSFFIRNHNLIMKFIPFSGIIHYTKVLYDTATKGFVTSVENAMKEEREYLESKV